MIVFRVQIQRITIMALSKVQLLDYKLIMLLLDSRAIDILLSFEHCLFYLYRNHKIEFLIMQLNIVTLIEL